MNDRLAGYEGADRAAAHADRVEDAMGRPLWNKVAWVRFLEFILLMRVGDGFTMVAFRQWAEERGLPPPPDPRAYGNISKRAAKDRLIRDTGERMKRGFHGREIVVWERAK